MAPPFPVFWKKFLNSETEIRTITNSLSETIFSHLSEVEQLSGENKISVELSVGISVEVIIGCSVSVNSLSDDDSIGFSDEGFIGF